MIVLNNRLMQPEPFETRTDDGLILRGRIWENPSADREIWITHGMGDHGGRYLRLARELVQHGFRVILPDHRGNGLSDGKRGHAAGIQTFVRDLKKIYDQTGVESNRKYVLGQSMGGLITARFLQTQEHQVTAGILLSPMFRTTRPAPKTKLMFARLVKLIYPSLTLRAGFRTNDLTSDENRKADYRKDDLKHDRVSASLGLSLFQQGELALREVEKIDIPLLVMHGDLDSITCPEASREFSGNSGRVTYKLWQGKRHELHNEAENQEIIEYMLNWLTSH